MIKIGKELERQETQLLGIEMNSGCIYYTLEGISTSPSGLTISFVNENVDEGYGGRPESCFLALEPAEILAKLEQLGASIIDRETEIYQAGVAEGQRRSKEKLASLLD